MENINDIGYRMHFYRAFDMYMEICEDIGAEPSQKAIESKEIRGAFSVKYDMIKAELSKLLKERVLPIWVKELPNFFDEKDISDAELLIKMGFDFIPEDTYDIYLKIFDTLFKLKYGMEDEVKKYLESNLRYMTVDEVIKYYDFVIHSNYGNKVLDVIYNQIDKNSENLPPETVAYFNARRGAQNDKLQAEMGIN